jgi:hypothetical protein
MMMMRWYTTRTTRRQGGVTQSCLSHTLVLGSNGGGSTRERGDTCNARHGGVTQSCLRKNGFWAMKVKYNDGGLHPHICNKREGVTHSCLATMAVGQPASAETRAPQGKVSHSRACHTHSCLAAMGVGQPASAETRATQGTVVSHSRA